MSARRRSARARDAVRNEVAAALAVCERDVRRIGDEREADELLLLAARLRRKGAERAMPAAWGPPWISKQRAAELLPVLGLDGEPSGDALQKRIDRATTGDAFHVLRRRGPARSPSGRLSEGAVLHVAALLKGSAEVAKGSIEEGKAMARAARDRAVAEADPARVAAQGRRHLDHADRTPLHSLLRAVTSANTDKR